jgi:peptidoglycan/xylan/chitin deacetylase (PgdA/CDA1 family)
MLPLARFGRRQPEPAGLREPSLRLTNTPAGARTIAVTLDACPGKFDHRIADMLVAKNIPATIFVTEIWMRWNPDGLNVFKSHPAIFSLQNHGAKHLPPVLGDTKIYGISPAGTLPAIKTEILGGAAAITQATGIAPGWYRGAAGIYSPEAIPFIEVQKFLVAGYSLNADEGASLPASIVAARIAAAQDGDVIVGHINQPHRESGAGIAAGLAGLQAAGARFVQLDQIVTA